MVNAMFGWPQLEGSKLVISGLIDGAKDQTSSLSLAMGLTTILTTIWVCPPT